MFKLVLFALTTTLPGYVEAQQYVGPPAPCAPQSNGAGGLPALANKTGLVGPHRALLSRTGPARHRNRHRRRPELLPGQLRHRECTSHRSRPVQQLGHRNR